VKEGYAYQDGLFSGYEEARRDYNRSSWSYEMGDDGFVKVDETLEHPRTVWNLLKAHVKTYTPDMVSRITGTPTDKYLAACKMIAETSAPDKAMTSMYALGWTQHSKGSQIIRCMAMLQLVLGNMGLRGGGMNALRGHSNIQGLTDLGLMSNLIPGYLTLPTDADPDIATYLGKRGFKPMRPGQVSFWQNYSKFFVSFQKAMYGPAATKDNAFAYDYLPKLDVPAYDVLRAFEMMHQGQMNGYICQGFNPLMSFPNKAKIKTALAKLKYLVVMDPLQTETARFWEDHGEFNPSKPEDIKTAVFELPTTTFAEDEGSLTNSSRWLQWHWPGGTSRRGQDRHLDHGAALSAHQSAVREGGRRIPGCDQEPPLAVQGYKRSSPGRDRPRDQRLRFGGRARSGRSEQETARERQTDRRLRRLAR
jgi:formate dehydrogenase major subunit